MNSNSLSEQLRRWRGVHGDDKAARGRFSQSEAAAHLGVPVGTYRDWEQGRVVPREITLDVVLAQIRTKPVGWSKKAPTVAGVYWHWEADGPIRICEVTTDDDTLAQFIGNDELHLVSLMKGEWAGPLNPP